MLRNPGKELSADGAACDPWRLCTVQQVEEVKCLVRLLPVWSSGIVYYIVLTNLGNYGVLQAMQTDRRLGRSGFQIPAGSLVVFNMLALTAWLPVYDGVVVPALRLASSRLILGLRGRRAMAAATVATAAAARVPAPRCRWPVILPQDWPSLACAFLSAASGGRGWALLCCGGVVRPSALERV